MLDSVPRNWNSWLNIPEKRSSVHSVKEGF
jgi:hypothetical protein